MPGGLPVANGPDADIHPTSTMLRSQPAYRPFAARAKSGDGRTHSLRDIPAVYDFSASEGS
ncbi:MAG: hypothetical protein ACI9KS_002626 [Sulfitobacter sp.]|jgi:hypothetical protein